MTAAKKSYDGIIVGSGHHALVLGTYLARLGLKILVVERRLMYGGGLATVEAIANNDDAIGALADCHLAGDCRRHPEYKACPPN